MKILIVIAVALWISVSASKILSGKDITDNEVDTDSNSDWVTIKLKKNEIKAFAGEIVEIECEASGSPQPKIHFYNEASDLKSNSIFSNDVPQYSSTGLAKAVGKLRFIAKKKQVIICKATSGSKTVLATIKVAVSGVHSNLLENEVWDYESSEKSARFETPLITFYDTMYLEDIGNTVLLPCTAVGDRDTKIFWIDPKDNIIDGNDDNRITVTSLGELKISNIHWSDMGSYTCVARNTFGKDKIATFLYPMLIDV